MKLDGGLVFDTWSFERGNIEDMVTGLGSHGDIALDTAAGKLYGTGSGTDKIQRADLNGNNVEDLVTSGLDSSQFIALAVPCPDACGCGNGMDGMMVMPMTLLGISWMRRLSSRPFQRAGAAVAR